MPQPLPLGVARYTTVTLIFFFFQAEDGIRDLTVTGVQTCALPISVRHPVVAQENQGRIAVRPCPTARRAAARRAWPATPARADRRDLRAVRELHPPVSLGVNPSADALRATFGGAIARAAESCGDTIVYVDRAALLAVMAWLRDTPGQQ